MRSRVPRWLVDQQVASKPGVIVQDVTQGIPIAQRLFWPVDAANLPRLTPTGVAMPPRTLRALTAWAMAFCCWRRGRDFRRWFRCPIADRYLLMRSSIVLAILPLGAVRDTHLVEAQENRIANGEHLAAYNDSGGWAYWHDAKRGKDSSGTELMVRRSNRPELRVPTKPLYQMGGVTKLILHGVDFTDAELEGISQMKDLPALLINGKITDDGLRHLDGLTSLKELWIYQTHVDGAGLRYLKKLNELEYLCIDSELSEEGLAQLTGMTQLKRLTVPGLEDDRTAKLQRALPGTRIND